MLSHLRVWEYPACVKRLKTNKLGTKSDRCLFIGYPKKTKRYYFYLVAEQKVFVSSRTVFLEKEFLGEEANACKIELDEVHEVKGPTHTELDSIGESNLKSIEAPLRRSGRVPHQPDKYYDFLIRDDDPLNLMRTMKIQSPIWRLCKDPTSKNGLKS